MKSPHQDPGPPISGSYLFRRIRFQPEPETPHLRSIFACKASQKSEYAYSGILVIYFSSGPLSSLTASQVSFYPTKVPQPNLSPKKKKKKKISLKRVADVTLAELTRGGHRENQSSPPLRSYFSCHRHFPPPGTRDGHVWVRDTWRRRRGGIVCIRRWM